VVFRRSMVVCHATVPRRVPIRRRESGGRIVQQDLVDSSFDVGIGSFARVGALASPALLMCAGETRVSRTPGSGRVNELTHGCYLDCGCRGSSHGESTNPV